mmetsp:Transcript_18276/g.52282  ORF Transcript_18276/g.52282 Transcript_18276/m.52282 type:complete len:253 (-) Transcript_18276:155-913(-)
MQHRMQGHHHHRRRRHHRQWSGPSPDRARPRRLWRRHGGRQLRPRRRPVLLPTRARYRREPGRRGLLLVPPSSGPRPAGRRLADAPRSWRPAVEGAGEAPRAEAPRAEAAGAGRARRRGRGQQDGASYRHQGRHQEHRAEGCPSDLEGEACPLLLRMEQGRAHRLESRLWAAAESLEPWQGQGQRQQKEEEEAGYRSWLDPGLDLHSAEAAAEARLVPSSLPEQTARTELRLPVPPTAAQPLLSLEAIRLYT